jgi:DMSO/TMAO reductase YedYZ molybdopterin-dependent catalytic subunit
VLVFAAMAKRWTGVAFVEVAAKTEVESDDAVVAAEVVSNMGPVVDAESVVEAKETGVKLAVVIKAAVKAARGTPEVALEGMLVLMVDGEVAEVVQTPGVEAGSGTVSGAVEEREGAGVSRMMLRIGFLNSCVSISHM